MLIGEPVVEVEWPRTLKLVNAPANITLLNPGQCIRVGVVATGDNRDAYLDQIRVSFRVRFNGQTDEHPFAAYAQTKQIKPEGGDFVTAALAAGGIKNPLLTMASLGATADKWCVPSNAADGTATVEAEAEVPGGRVALTPSKVQIESFASGSSRKFKNIEEFGNYSQTYYRQPNPARLVPALQMAIESQTANPKSDLIGIASAFLSAALKADPLAEKDFLARMPEQTPLVRSLGLVIVHSAGYDIDSVVKTLSAEDQEKLKSIPPMPDPFDLSPTREVFGHLDLMWSTFGATGDFKPVATIASTLAWRADYDEFDKMRKSGTHPSEITPSLARGLAYMAAGWSMESFQRNDPLVADYIEFMLASPDVSPEIKTELTGLSTNPAFKRDKAN
jgi:hypothetical protein